MHLSDVVGETCPANVACLRARVRHIMHPVSIAPMKPAAAKVGGNHGPIAGRRLAVGFLQIVPGVFPTGVVTDRLRFRLTIFSGHTAFSVDGVIVLPFVVAAMARRIFHLKPRGPQHD